jgi:hypothetical protein
MNKGALYIGKVWLMPSGGVLVEDETINRHDWRHKELKKINIKIRRIK